MAAEEMLAADLLMNFGILVCVQFALGRLHLPSVTAALAVMSVNTVIGRLLGLPHWDSFLIQSAVCALCGAIIARSRRISQIITASLAIFCATTSAAGLAFLSGRLSFAAVLALAIVAFLLRRRRNPAVQWNITVSVTKNGVSDRFNALIDTGNHLTEHRSALPVLIVEESAVPHLSQLLPELDPDEIHTLGFGVLGSCGELPCLYPDEILIYAADSPPVSAPPCWVGVFSGRIPGRTRALAPPEFAEYTMYKPVLSAEINHLRRISYAIFNRQTVHLRPRGADQTRFGLLHRRQ